MALVSTHMWRKINRINHRHLLPDALLIVVSLYTSLLLRVGFEEMGQFGPILSRYVPLFVVLRVGTFTLFGVYDIIWRYVSLRDSAKLGRAVLISTLLIISATYLFDLGRIPRAVFFIDALLTLLLLGGVRFARRFVYEQKNASRGRELGLPTLVVGAGVFGRALVSRLQVELDTGLRVVGFIDDDPQKLGRFIAGHRVLGGIADLAATLKESGATTVLVAIAKPSGPALRTVVTVCRSLGVSVRLAQPMAREVDLTGDSPNLRSVELADLLNRPHKHCDLAGVKAIVENKRVLVTGAGGTIGSELARQIRKLKPSRLLLLDHSEFNLYQIDRELRNGNDADGVVTPLLVDLKSYDSLAQVFQNYLPDVVIHAAAYKHVDLVERNPDTSIVNNIGGTDNLLKLAEAFQVGSFLLISTDKAVNPAGVMGATKRLCELMVARVGMLSGHRYCSVRFGNVLGSSGSLIPLLTEQIQKRQAITITHPDMTRYFMLVDEAVSLVLNALAVSQPGETLILDMGEPVKILDMARSLYALIGDERREPEIVFTGPRPGEKLFEELYFSGQEIATQTADIFVVPITTAEKQVASVGFLESVREIVELAQQGSPNAVIRLKQLVECLPLPKTTSSTLETASPWLL